MWAGLDRAQAGPDSPSTLDTMCTPPPMIEDSKECPFPPSPSHKGRHSRRTRERSDGRRKAGTSPNADRQHRVCNDTHAFACMHAPMTPHTRTNTEAPTVNVHTLIYSWQNKQRQQGSPPRSTIVAHCPNVQQFSCVSLPNALNLALLHSQFF